MALSAAADIRPALLDIDDDSRVCTVVCWQLEAEGYLVREEADRNAACQCIADHRPDLVILDLSLPGMSGLDLLRRSGTPATGRPSSSCQDTAARTTGSWGWTSARTTTW